MRLGTRIALALLAVLLPAIVFLALLEWRFPGILRGLAGWTKEQVEAEELTGRVVDVATGAGVPGATVVARSNSSWMNPTIMGGSSHGYATTDGQGRFAIRYQELGSTRVSARAPGYATVMRMRWRGRPLDLPTSRVPPGDSVAFARFTVELPAASPVARVDLARGAAVAAGEPADLAFTLAADSTRRLFIEALGQGGLFEEPPPEQPLLVDALAGRCTAPESGYAAADTIAERGSMATWIVRGSGGAGFARVRILVQRTPPRRDVAAAVTVECWRNTTGGRSVCMVPAEGERVEFRELDRPGR